MSVSNGDVTGEIDANTGDLKHMLSVLAKEKLVDLICSASTDHSDVFSMVQTAVNESPLSRRLMIRNISFATTDDSFASLLGELGAMEDCVIVRDKEGRSKGYGFVTFKTLSAALKCLNSELKLDDRGLIVKLAADFPRATASGKRKLFIRNLPDTCDNNALKTCFSRFGEILECSILPGRSGKSSKAFAFVTFSNAEEAANAVSEQRKTISGQQVYVSFAMERKSNQPNPYQQISWPPPAIMDPSVFQPAACYPPFPFYHHPYVFPQQE
eukprot:GHVU01036163.1.p1 GENE.GHVU01036163.1~~GHVU01036163.1.p1  ORF type:complete len:270 (+),score=31.02 GHVU01036163.1:58-867(+)